VPAVPVAGRDIAARAGAAVEPRLFDPIDRAELAGLPSGYFLKAWLGEGDEGLTTDLPALGLPVLTYLQRDLEAGWRAQRASAARTHDNQIVLPDLDLVDERGPHRLAALHGADRYSIGDPLDGCPHDRLGLGLGVAGERRRHITACAHVGGGGRRHHRAEEGQTGVL
jgi:hypothetical protein